MIGLGKNGSNQQPRHRLLSVTQSSRWKDPGPGILCHEHVHTLRSFTICSTKYIMLYKGQTGLLSRKVRTRSMLSLKTNKNHSFNPLCSYRKCKELRSSKTCNMTSFLGHQTQARGKSRSVATALYWMGKAHPWGKIIPFAAHFSFSYSTQHLSTHFRLHLGTQCCRQQLASSELQLSPMSLTSKHHTGLHTHHMSINLLPLRLYNNKIQSLGTLHKGYPGLLCTFCESTSNKKFF